MFFRLLGANFVVVVFFAMVIGEAHSFCLHRAHVMTLSRGEEMVVSLLHSRQIVAVWVGTRGYTLIILSLIIFNKAGAILSNRQFDFVN